MTGTGLIAACSALAKLGIIVFTDDDDYDKSSYAASEGKSGVQINFSALGRMIEGNKADLEDGDTLINCDNFQPIKSIMCCSGKDALQWICRPFHDADAQIYRQRLQIWRREH